VDIVHGDLTTSNMLVSCTTSELVMIDFGLASTSSMVEDKAVDLYVLERAIKSTHPEYERYMMQRILKSYADEPANEDSESVLKKLDQGTH
jgi:TP53 regulating kinase-like protein